MILAEIFTLILFLAYLFAIYNFIFGFECDIVGYITLILMLIDLILFIIAKVIGINL